MAPRGDKKAPVEEQVTHDQPVRLRAAAPAAPKIITRKFYLDSPLGEVEVTVKGPAGAAKLTSTHTSIAIVTGDADAVEILPERRAPRAAAKPAPVLSGNPNEPGGTTSDWLPGDDAAAEDAARSLQPDSLSFLRSTEKSILRRGELE